MVIFNYSSQIINNLNDTNEAANVELQFSEGITYIIIVLISLLIFLTVFGNILVMVAFVIDKRLRTQSNFFLLNLAICDLLLGAVAIPLYIPYLLTGKWMLGAFLCKLWLVVDYTMCTASAFNVALISFDRFLCVTKAVLYRSLQNRHSQTVLRMAVVWILSFLLYSPAILLWDSIVGYTYISEGLCIAGFHYTWYFLLVASSIGFALPFLSISFFNLSIYWNISTRSRKKRQSAVILSSRVKGDNGNPHIVATNAVLSSAQSAIKGDYKPHLKRKGNISIPFKQSCGRKKLVTIHNDHAHITEKQLIIKLSKDKKVAKSLAVLVCIFAVCWAPYTFLNSIRAACHGYCIDYYWYEVAFWLLWMNSAINPVLYPLCHEQFRKAFHKVFAHICLWKTAERNT
ncbi:histamine H3 receptor-like [Lithobates pipiens]